jgi:MFS family permease
MSVTTAGAADSRAAGGFWSTLRSRQLDSYPNTGPRMAYLGLVVIITTALYYELYVGGSVATLQLAALHMSFSFYVLLLAFGNLIGAFGSLLAGLTDRLGRCNLVVGGLLITGVMVAFILPEASSRWSFGIESFAVGLVEGICLVATPALVRDFSPQVGRGAAMGFWTMGPVLGSLVVAVVGSNTINASTAWPHEYRICGTVGLVVFVLALLFLRELSPGLRDQLMVTTRDRALIEAKAKGLDIEASLKNPFRQLLKPEIVISAIGVSVLLLSYYTAVAFGTVYFETIFGFSLKDANGLGNWNWGINAIALVLAGVVSDRFRVRKPFMVIGGVWAAIAMVFWLSAAGHHDSYYHIALLTSVLSFGLGIAYVAWMASFTESVEARNPALTATGLAIWGWIIRVTIFASFLVLPLVINTVNPLVDNGARAQLLAQQYAAPLAFDQSPTGKSVVAFAQSPTGAKDIAFAQTHAKLIAFAQSPTGAKDIAFAQSHAALIAFAQSAKGQAAIAFAQSPSGQADLTVIQANPALFTKLATYSSPTTIPPALLGQALAAAGGGTKGAAILQSINTNKATIGTVVANAGNFKALAANAATFTSLAANAGNLKAVAANAGPLKALAASAPQLKAVAANSTQLTALSKIPKADIALLTSVQHAASKSPGQWKDWYWICFGGVVIFLLCIPLAKGRWSPSKAKADEDAHEAMVQAEMAKLNA